MLRSRLGPKTYEAALEAQIARQNRRRERPANKVSENGNGHGALKARKPTLRKKPKSPEMLEFERIVRERDGYQCRWVDSGKRCDYKSPTITVHHINERSQRPDLITDPENGACLCNRHHFYAHNNVKGREEAEAQKLLGGQTYEYRDR